MDKKPDLELWGGIECTINRIGNTYVDQLNYSGHYKSKSDIDLIATLGIRKLRYPVIWEKHKPKPELELNFGSIEDNLKRLLELDIDPIIGLVHHGSGPDYATIDSDDFAPGLADYALQVAKRFPWVNYYTPINEPLTTARFCGLYGLWYPHSKSDESFMRLLLNETMATILTMRAIRTINPNAKLVQTEDLGKTYSTPLLRYQADFENKRRWLSLDLLLGRVEPHHPLWEYITTTCRISEDDLQFFIENPCPPDIIGFNHYPTSERYLDEDLKQYPVQNHGHNNKLRYADVEAVRVDITETTGAYALLKEAWEYFKIPMAITEVHLGCTRDEQLRWFKEIWDTSSRLIKEDIVIKAVTAWAMFGSYGWDKLLTSPGGTYESGIFDESLGMRRPTALLKLIQACSKGQNFKHPILETPGWWKKNLRLIYPKKKDQTSYKCSQPLLILGKTGTLGNAFAKICDLRGIHYQLLDRNDLDINDSKAIERLIGLKRPWAIVNAIGYVRVDQAENNYEECLASNAYGPAKLAQCSAKYGIKLMNFSSDLVFDGTKAMPYLESDYVSPLNVYGKSKAMAEKYILECDPASLIIRTSAFFGPWDKYNFVTDVISSLRKQEFYKTPHDILISPTYIPDLVNTSLDLLLDDECGIWHLANKGSITWYELACNVAQHAGLGKHLIIPTPTTEFNYHAKRPVYSVLGSERGSLMPTLDDAISRYFDEQQLF